MFLLIECGHLKNAVYGQMAGSLHSVFDSIIESMYVIQTYGNWTDWSVAYWARTYSAKYVQANNES